VFLPVTQAYEQKEVMRMIAKAFAMYMGGSKHKRTARPREARRSETRPVRRVRVM
jgi:hypothetical protein